MEYKISEKQLDRLMKPYWDTMFKDSELGTIEEYTDDGDDWRGIIKNTSEGKIMLVGYPYLDIGDTWYSNGQYFDGGWQLFNINTDVFNYSMARYIRDKFDVKIQSVI